MIKISKKKIMAFLMGRGERPSWKKRAAGVPVFATVIQENVSAPVQSYSEGSCQVVLVVIRGQA